MRAAMVLAAGYGTRLRPVTDVVPKPLVPVGNVPLLGRHLESLAAIGVERVVVNVSHLAPQIERYLGDGSAWGLEVTVSREPEPAGTGGGLARVRDVLAREEAFLVINGDISHDYDLAAIAALRGDADAVVAIRDIGVQFPNALGVDDAGQVVSFPGSPQPAGSPVDFGGVHVLTPAIFEHLPRSGSIFVHGYAPLLRTGARVLAYEQPDLSWFDVGSPDGLLRANAFAAAAGGARPPAVSPDASIRPPVLIAQDAVLEPGCTVGPDAVVGAGATIGSRAYVANSLVWPGERVAPGAVVDRAIVYPGGILHAVA